LGSSPVMTGASRGNTAQAFPIQVRPTPRPDESIPQATQSAINPKRMTSSCRGRLMSFIVLGKNQRRLTSLVGWVPPTFLMPLPMQYLRKVGSAHPTKTDDSSTPLGRPTIVDHITIEFDPGRVNAPDVRGFPSWDSLLRRSAGAGGWLPGFVREGLRAWRRFLLGRACRRSSCRRSRAGP